MTQLSEHQTFVHVVDSGSFSAAARSLGVSKSHVSKQIGRLEERLGARLLQRTTRRVALTEAGRAFYERCARILEDLEEAELAVSRMQSTPTGTLRLTAPFSFGLDYVAPAVGEFLHQHARLNVDLDYTDRYVDIVGEGYDMAVRIGKLRDSSLIARKLAPMRLFTVASPDYLKTAGIPGTPEDLRTHSCLQYTLRHGGTNWQFSNAAGAEVSVKVDGRVQCNNGDALLVAACSGLGVAMLPDFIAAPALRKGELKVLLDEWADTSSAIWLVYPHNRHLSAKVRLFVDFLMDRVTQGPHDFTLSDTEILRALA